MSGHQAAPTPITDVVEPYGHVVPIADNLGEFVAACEGLLRWTHGSTGRADAAEAVSLVAGERHASLTA
jgi:hypothetical protein